MNLSEMTSRVEILWLHLTHSHCGHVMAGRSKQAAGRLVSQLGRRLKISRNPPNNPASTPQTGQVGCYIGQRAAGWQLLTTQICVVIVKKASVDELLEELTHQEMSDCGETAVISPGYWSTNGPLCWVVVNIAHWLYCTKHTCPFRTNNTGIG